MYDELYYFDGCSYMAGHCHLSRKTMWVNTINPYVGKDGNIDKNEPFNGCLDARKYPFYNMATVAKSNEEIYQDFIDTLPNLIKANNVKVFIHWSHSERKAKEKNQAFITRDCANFDEVIKEWWKGLARTVPFMLDVQEKCKEHGLEYVAITTEHPEIFELGRKHNDAKYSNDLDKINSRDIFNWPLRKLQNFPKELNDRADALLTWGCTSLPISWCKGFGLPIAEDMKHLGDEARLRFGQQVHDFYKDRNKDLSYWIDEDVKPVNKEFFYDLQAWVDELKGGALTRTTHWVEEDLRFLLINMTIMPNAEYIYED